MFNPITHHFLDKQWSIYPGEPCWLMWRKLACHLTPPEQRTLWRRLFGSRSTPPFDVVSSTTAQAQDPDCTTVNVADDAIISSFVTETEMQSIYERFGVYGLGNLMHFAIFTGEEEIKITVES